MIVWLFVGVNFNSCDTLGDGQLEKQAGGGFLIRRQGIPWGRGDVSCKINLEHVLDRVGPNPAPSFQVMVSSLPSWLPPTS